MKSIHWILLIGLSRILPLPANASPLLTMVMFLSYEPSLLLTGSSLASNKSWLTYMYVICICLAGLLLSDYLLHLLHGYPILGSWTWATYSGCILVVICSRILTRFIQHTAKDLILCVLTVQISYWTWTNFAVWLNASMYPLNISGLVACYTAALPFLGNALLAGLLWSGLIYGLDNRSNNRRLSYGY